jgi:hypothetical protein
MSEEGKSGGVTLALVLAGEERGFLLALSSERARIVSPSAAPPGARIDASLEVDPSMRLRIKVHSARRLDNRPGFLIEGRPLDLPRETRERIAKLLGGGDFSPPKLDQT